MLSGSSRALSAHVVRFMTESVLVSALEEEQQRREREEEEQQRRRREEAAERKETGRVAEKKDGGKDAGDEAEETEEEKRARVERERWMQEEHERMQAQKDELREMMEGDEEEEVPVTALLRKVLSLQHQVLRRANVMEARNCFRALMTLAASAEDDEDRAELVNDIVQSLTATTPAEEADEAASPGGNADKSEAEARKKKRLKENLNLTENQVRLIILADVFNACPDGDIKLQVLRAIVSFAGKHDGLFALVEDRLEALERTVAAIPDDLLAPGARRELTLTLVSVCERLGRKTQALKHLLKYAQSFDSSSGNNNDSPRSPTKDDLQLVEQTIVAAIRTQSTQDVISTRAALLRAGVVQQLAAQSPDALTLLGVFCNGDLQAYDQFAQTSAAQSWMNSWELSRDSCRDHMRVLTLCSLAATAPDRTLPYTAVTEALRLEDAQELEGWVIRATGEHGLNARLNELENTIRVRNDIQRDFSLGQWRRLRAMLIALRESVDSVTDATRAAAEPERQQRQHTAEMAAAQAQEVAEQQAAEAERLEAELEAFDAEDANPPAPPIGTE